MKFFLKDSKDVISHNPFWIALVLPFSEKYTFSKSDQGDINPVDIDTPIILDSEIQNYTVSSSKDSFTGVLQLTLYPNAPVDSFNSEDWIVFWAFNNAEDFDYTKSNLQKLINNQSCSVLNSFEKAPKFVGQISSVFVNESVNNSRSY